MIIVPPSVLKDIASILQSHCKRENDFVARIGGEEFAVILPNSNFESVKVLTAKIQHAVLNLKRLHKVSNVSDYLTISIGVKVINGSHPSAANEVYRLADAALYKAKVKRNNVVIEES